MINISFQLSVYCVLGYFHESGVGVEFIRPETGLINQTPTLIQGQVGLFPVFTGTGYMKTRIYLFLFSGTFWHDASCPYIGLLASGSFYSRDTRYAIRDTILFWPLAPDYYSLYEIRFTRYEIRICLVNLLYFNWNIISTAVTKNQ
ncbi:hypothetical protein ES703_113869 [subsurface metagenome]